VSLGVNSAIVMGRRREQGGFEMGMFKKQEVYWIDFYVNGHRKHERIGPDKRLDETILRKRKVEIAERNVLEKQRMITMTLFSPEIVPIVYTESTQEILCSRWAA
jgi:hypothetical protein